MNTKMISFYCSALFITDIAMRKKSGLRTNHCIMHSMPLNQALLSLLLISKWYCPVSIFTDNFANSDILYTCYTVYDWGCRSPGYIELLFPPRSTQSARSLDNLSY